MTFTIKFLVNIKNLLFYIRKKKTVHQFKDICGAKRKMAKSTFFTPKATNCILTTSLQRPISRKLKNIRKTKIKIHKMHIFYDLLKRYNGFDKIIGLYF